LEESISAVSKEIAEIETVIHMAATRVLEAEQSIPRDETILVYWQNKESQLRNKEFQLRNELSQLRNKEMKLLEMETKSGNIMPKSGMC
jgi:hypothetical protein